MSDFLIIMVGLRDENKQNAAIASRKRQLKS